MNGFRSAIGAVLTGGVLWTGASEAFAQATAEQRLAELEQKVLVLENKLKAAEEAAAKTKETPVLNAGGELEQKVLILERKLELADEAAAAKAKDAPVLTAGKTGFALTSADKAFQLKLRGYIQSDTRFYFDDDEKPAADTFVLRRVRPIFEGTVGKAIDFRLMPDFGAGTTVLQDAYVGLTLAPAAKLRLGKFKAPFGLERLQSATDIAFIERGYPTSLAPNRDIGLQLSGDFADGVLQYALGVFNGVTDGGSADSDTADGKDVVARLFSHPFKNTDVTALSGLGIGVAASFGDQEGSPSSTGLPSYKTPGQQTFFSYTTDAKTHTEATAAKTAVADGARTRIGPQAYYYYGPLSLLAEYTLSSTEVRTGALTDTLQNDAWQVVAAYVLTGEDASFKGVSPKRPFDLSKSQWGAFEVATRFGELTIDQDAFPDFAKSGSAEAVSTWGVGLNWYLSKNAKIAVDYEQSWFDGGAATGDRDDEKLVLARGQVSF